jgi:hypothetical protein
LAPKVVDGALNFDTTINLNESLEIFGAVFAVVIVIDLEYPRIILEEPSQSGFDSAYTS